MNQALSEEVLQSENIRFLGTGGRSQENGSSRFRPAFMDLETCAIYPSRFANGSPAPIHLLDGLPPEAVLSRTPSGRVAKVKPSVISGFTLDGVFFTREAAARKASELA